MAEGLDPEFLTWEAELDPSHGQKRPLFDRESGFGNAEPATEDGEIREVGSRVIKDVTFGEFYDQVSAAADKEIADHKEADRSLAEAQRLHREYAASVLRPPSIWRTIGQNMITICRLVDFRNHYK